jgi:ABC-type multidrug transport system fused ATPase/permease subunit
MAKSLTGVNFSQGLRSTVQGVFGLGYMFHLSPELTGIVAGVVPLVLGGAWIYGRFIRKLSAQVQNALSAATDVANEKLGNIRTVRAFAQEDEESGRYNLAVTNVFNLARKEAVANGLFFASAGLAGSAAVLGVLYAGGQMVLQGQGLTAGVLSSFLMYTFYVGLSVGYGAVNFFTDCSIVLTLLLSFMHDSSVSGAYADAMKGIGASTRIFQILDTLPTIPNRYANMRTHH